MTKKTESIITINDLIQQQEKDTVNSKQFINYTSKKQLINSNVLSKQQQDVIEQLKNCFSFSLHTSNKFLVITMYYSKTTSYNYITVNLSNFEVQQFTSVKSSKQYVLQQVNDTTTKKVKTK